MNVCSDNGSTSRRAGWTLGAVLAALMLPVCGLPGAVQAQPVDAVCLEDPSAGCLAGAAALEFAGIDDAEIWQFDNERLVTPLHLAQILVETGRDEALAVFLGKASAVAPLVHENAVGAAAAAFAGAGNLTQARALIALPLDGGNLSRLIMYQVRSSMVRRGDVDGLIWLDTALAEIERSGAKLPYSPVSVSRHLESVSAAELSGRLRDGGTENCTGIEPDQKIWVSVWGSMINAPRDDDLTALLGLCFWINFPGVAEDVGPKSIFDPFSAPIRIDDPALEAKLRRAILAGAGLNAQADGTPAERFAFSGASRAAILTLFEAGQAQDLLVHWMTRASGDDALASGYASALGTALATGNRPDLLRQLSDPPSGLEWGTRVNFAMLFAVYGAIAGDEDLIATALESTGNYDWGDSMGLFILRLLGTAPFNTCTETLAETWIKHLSVRVLAANDHQDAAIRLAREQLCAAELPAGLFEVAVLSQSRDLQQEALVLASQLEDRNERALALAQMARIAHRAGQFD
ncbi:MAG: hypothetical protein IOD01_16540 [Rhodobacter sp.]|nr:hypothetical protein [Rhodobacter sp.]